MPTNTGLGAGVDAYFPSTPRKTKEDRKPKAAPERKRTRTPGTTPAEGERTKVTIWLDADKVNRLEQVKAEERAKGKRRADVTLTALIDQAVTEFLKRRGK